MILGLTGGVATGKSTILGMLPAVAGRSGAQPHSISADAVARDLLDPGTLFSRKVIEHFGQQYALGGEIDVVNRAMLGRLIFADIEARKWLESLLHPLIIEALKDAGAPYKGKAARTLSYPGIMVMEAPLLFEAGLEHTVDQVLVTHCQEETQIRRIMSRRADTTRDDALRQIAAQLPQSEKARRADFVIDTDQPLDRVKLDFERIFEIVMRWAPHET